MLVNNTHYRTIWSEDQHVYVIDQRVLPHNFSILKLSTLADMCHAIHDMAVRGAGLIGASAGFGMALAAQEWANTKNTNNLDTYMFIAAQKLCATRPTAVNLQHATNRVLAACSNEKNIDDKIHAIQKTAQVIANEDAEFCRKIGEHGLKIIEEIYARKKDTVNILTHCNAGWLAFVDYGSALSPIYLAKEKNIPVHIWVDETRPRNQGASLTAWELLSADIPHSVIADNTGGHLMQHNMVDMVIVGADRVTRQGDVANKIGTYLKALAAFDNKIPFYVALPSSTFDFSIKNGVEEIPIELRSSTEVKYISGLMKNNKANSVLLTPKKSKAVNYAFDVTPARLVTKLITERGTVSPNENDILATFNDVIRH